MCEKNLDKLHIIHIELYYFSKYFYRLDNNNNNNKC